MACCGQKREAVRTPARAQVRAPQRVTPAAPARPARAAALAPGKVEGLALSGVEGAPGVMLQYRNRSPITVRGAGTGRRYEFLCGGATQTVDVKDAEALIATGLFDRIRS